jgi:hypothetical protein
MCLRSSDQFVTIRRSRLSAANHKRLWNFQLILLDSESGLSGILLTSSFECVLSSNEQRQEQRHQQGEVKGKKEVKNEEGLQMTPGRGQ